MMLVSNNKGVKTMGDEIKALGQINDALNGLEIDEARRVLSWAVDKYDPTGQLKQQVQSNSKAGGGSGPEHNGAKADPPDGQYERISDLVDAASPLTIVDYVLVASYWFQVIGGKESVAAQEVNSALKDLGHGSSNITDSFTSLIGRKPAHVRQIQKAGSTRQARKRYRITEAGLKAVARMLSGE
jgi:hypothetical protein